MYFIEKHIGVKPSSLLVAFAVFITIVTLISNTTNIIIGLVCSLIPGYFTFIALESEDKQDDIKYLTYWIIFALIEAMAPMLTFILPSTIYVILRIALTLALLHPSINLTVKIYMDWI